MGEGEGGGGDLRKNTISFGCISHSSDFSFFFFFWGGGGIGDTPRRRKATAFNFLVADSCGGRGGRELRIK